MFIIKEVTIFVKDFKDERKKVSPLTAHSYLHFENLRREGKYVNPALSYSQEFLSTGVKLAVWSDFQVEILSGSYSGRI